MNFFTKKIMEWRSEFTLNNPPPTDEYELGALWIFGARSELYYLSEHNDERTWRLALASSPSTLTMDTKCVNCANYKPS